MRESSWLPQVWAAPWRLRVLLGCLWAPFVRWKKLIGECYGHLICTPKWFKKARVGFPRDVLIALSLERDTTSPDMTISGAAHFHPNFFGPKRVCPLRQKMLIFFCGAGILFLCSAGISVDQYFVRLPYKELSYEYHLAWKMISVSRRIFFVLLWHDSE